MFQIAASKSVAKSKKSVATDKRTPSPSKTRKQKRFSVDIDNTRTASKYQESSSDDSYLDTSDDESILKTAEEDRQDLSEAEVVTLSEEDHISDEGEDIEDLAEELERLEIMVKQFGIDFVMPFIMYDYINEGRRHVTVDFLVLTQNKEKFQPTVMADGNELHVGTVVPSFFQNRARIMLANKNKDKDFTSNTHKATAFEEVVRRMMTDLDWPDDLHGSTQRTKLPFPCEEDIISWEVQAFENEDDELTFSLGQQYFFVLSVELISAEKMRKEKAAGGFVMFKSPTGKRSSTHMADE